jgi:hypothetical protein
MLVRLIWLTPTTSKLPPTARHSLGLAAGWIGAAYVRRASRADWSNHAPAIGVQAEKEGQHEHDASLSGSHGRSKDSRSPRTDIKERRTPLQAADIFTVGFVPSRSQRK